MPLPFNPTSGESLYLRYVITQPIKIGAVRFKLIQDQPRLRSIIILASQQHAQLTISLSDFILVHYTDHVIINIPIAPFNWSQSSSTSITIMVFASEGLFAFFVLSLNSHVNPLRKSSSLSFQGKPFRYSYPDPVQ